MKTIESMRAWIEYEEERVEFMKQQIRYWEILGHEVATIETESARYEHMRSVGWTHEQAMKALPVVPMTAYAREEANLFISQYRAVLAGMEEQVAMHKKKLTTMTTTTGRRSKTANRISR